MIKALLVTLLMLPALLQAEERDIAYEKINTVLNVDTQSPLLQVKLAVDISDASLPFEEVQIWLVQMMKLLLRYSSILRMALFSFQRLPRERLDVIRCGSTNQKSWSRSVSVSQFYHHPTRQ